MRKAPQGATAPSGVQAGWARTHLSVAGRELGNTSNKMCLVREGHQKGQLKNSHVISPPSSLSLLKCLINASKGRNR